MNSEEFVKKVYVSEIEGPSRRGRPLGRWKDRVKEYMCERGATRERERERENLIYLLLLREKLARNTRT